MAPKIISLISVVLLIAWMFYLFMGCLPLLILKHDDPSDSRLVRGFFDVHYRVLMVIAVVGTLGSSFSGRQLVAAAFGFIAVFGFTARQLIVSRMDRLRDTMTATDAPAIRSFRRLHITGLALNIVLLAGFFGALALSSTDFVSCVEEPPGCKDGNCRTVCSLL